MVACGSSARTSRKRRDRAGHDQARPRRWRCVIVSPCCIAQSRAMMSARVFSRSDRTARSGRAWLTGFGRLDDRLVAGAATEIALQRLFDLAPGSGLSVRQPEAVERHDEARRAEAALRAVTIDHRLLHRMQRAVLGRQMLDGDDMGGIQRADETDAGIDRLRRRVRRRPAGRPARCRRRNRLPRILPSCPSDAG